MKLCDNYVMKNLANETILVHQDEKNVDFSKIINLNEIAVFIINKIQEGLNTLEICKAITKEYDIDEKTAKEEGIIFKLLTNPVKIEGEDGWVKSMECVEMELGEPDASGRRRPIAKEGSNFTIETGTVIVAIGQSPNPLIRHTTPGLDCQS